MIQTLGRLSQRDPLWVFEENYRLLTSLLPTPAGAEPARLVAPRSGQTLDVVPVERGRYTDTLLLTRSFAADQRLLPDLSMKVRLYYDARVAEVLAYQDCHRIPPRYQVVEGGQFSRDERRQVNHLLHEMLRNCRARGFRPVNDPDCTRA